jgi:hypothetical protein
MKKTYSTPTIEVVTLQQQDIICTSNEVTRVASSADINYGGGGSEPVRARENYHIDWNEYGIEGDDY